MVVSMLILILIFAIAPFLMGLVPAFFITKNRRTTSVIYLGGFILGLAFFQLMAVPIVILDAWGFELIVLLYSIIMAVLSAAGVILAFIKWKKEGNIFAEVTFKRNLTIEEVVEWVIFAALLIFQLVMFVKMASFDGDDAYYVVESLLTTESDTLYRIRPYTGLSTDLDLRHSLAVFPIWIAYASRVSGIHSTILCHSFMGLLLIPITYTIYLEIGRNVLKKERKKLPIFMIFIAIMQIFGNVSIYTNSTFLITRTWQGKSVLANICLPCVIWLLLNIFDSDNRDEDNTLGLWIILFSTNIVAAMSSTASVFLMAMLIGLSGLVLALREKNIQILLKLIITCIPLVVYGALYMLL